MNVPLCGRPKCLWERQHLDWVAFWCICGPPKKRTLGLDFSVREKQAVCTCHFPVLFPSENFFASEFVGNYRRSFGGPVALNDESVGSNTDDIPLIPQPEPLVIELSVSEGDPPTWGDAIDADFV